MIIEKQELGTLKSNILDEKVQGWQTSPLASGAGAKNNVRTPPHWLAGMGG